jgi:hypothetical protein
MGAAALEPLRRVAESSDRALAGRAAKLLRENPSTASTRTSVRPEEVHLEVSAVVVQTEGSRKWLFGALLANQSSLPVLLALAGEHASWRAAWFEVEDDQGRFTRMEASPEGAIATTGSVISVAPGKTLTFVGLNESSQALPSLKTRSVRFVYDASQSNYRAAAEKFGGGALLPSARLVSKTFLLAEAR